MFTLSLRTISGFLFLVTACARLTAATSIKVERLRQSPRVIASVAGLLLGVLSLSASGRADWSTYRSDIARSGVTSEGLNRALSLQWTYRPLQAPKPAWPAPSEELPRMHSDNAYHVAISQGLVYFGSSVDGQSVGRGCRDRRRAVVVLCRGTGAFRPDRLCGSSLFRLG